jgi:hypothetical protein
VYVRVRRVRRDRDGGHGDLDDRLGHPMRRGRRGEGVLGPRNLLGRRRGSRARRGVVKDRVCPLLLVEGEGR